MSRELLARAWAAGAGPGDAPLTIDLDSTICETYGLAKEGARHHGYTGKRGYHPLLAVAAGTVDVLMSPAARGPRQHRSGRPPTSCGRPWDGCAMLGPRGNSRCGPTAASTPTLSLPPAGVIGGVKVDRVGGRSLTTTPQWPNIPSPLTP